MDEKTATLNAYTASFRAYYMFNSSTSVKEFIILSNAPVYVSMLITLLGIKAVYRHMRSYLASEIKTRLPNIDWLIILLIGVASLKYPFS